MIRSILSLPEERKMMADILFMAAIGLFLGILGGFAGETVVGLVSAAILVGVFSAYNRVLSRNSGLVSGLLTGGLLGTVVGVVGWLVGGTIDGVFNGALFGLIRGAIIGAAIGFISRVEHEQTDRLATKLFLFTGSIGLGAFLGAGVGLTAGVILGLIGHGARGLLLAALAGAIVGGYLGSYYKKSRLILAGVVAGFFLAMASSLIGGAIGGVVLGAISGSFAPMLLVAGIGAVGGLTSRGLKAMVLEALEAPTEMLEQGAAPFLIPAVITGIIIGTAAAGPSGLPALPMCLAIVGLTLGVLGEIERRPNNRVSVRSLIEMAMMGVEEWPVQRAVRRLTGPYRRDAATGAVIGIVIGLLAGLAGSYIGQALAGLLTTLM